MEPLMRQQNSSPTTGHLVLQSQNSNHGKMWLFSLRPQQRSRKTKRILLQCVLGTPSIGNSLCTRPSHRQGKTPPSLRLSGRCSCGGLQKWLDNPHTIQRFNDRLTEMEVVVLGVANDEQEHNGVDDG